MAYDVCYVFDPITPNRKSIFSELLCYIPKGSSVLDIGCGPIGYYWAFAYAEYASRIGFMDHNEGFLQSLESELLSLDEARLANDFATTIKHIEGIQGRDIDTQALLSDIHTKITCIDKNDFLSGQKIHGTWDCIVAIESIECVDSVEELQRASQWVYDALEEKGYFFVYALRYDQATNQVLSSVAGKTDGMLNPSHELLISTLKQTGFTIIKDVCRKTDMHNYSSASYIIAKK